MNELQIFSNEEFGQVRTVVVDGSPWIVAKDVALALGYTDTSDAIKRHVDNEDKLTRCFTDSGQSREMYIINESGLYSLVFGSRLDSAQRFKRWVTSEVLPSIRKTGGYITPQAQSLELLQGMLDQMKLQNEEIQKATTQSRQALETTQTIKDTIIGTFDNWREEIKHLVASIQRGSNQTYQDTYSRLYDDLEKRAHCDLSVRVRNGRDRLTDSGATKTKVEAFGRMDVIEGDPKLREIFTTIVKEYAVKYVA